MLVLKGMVAAINLLLGGMYIWFGFFSSSGWNNKVPFTVLAILTELNSVLMFI